MLEIIFLILAVVFVVAVVFFYLGYRVGKAFDSVDLSKPHDEYD